MMKVIVTVAGLLATLSQAWGDEGPPSPARPNFLWLTWEDASPHLGCYGDAYAQTPVLDRLAARSILYRNAFTTSGACTPSRTCLFTGTYPTSYGTQHAYSQAKLPDGVSCFSAYLRAAGYYATNNAKTDYSFPVPKDAWDKSSGTADWKNRPLGKPFFAVFNYGGTHQSKTFAVEPPAKSTGNNLPLPPYHPDTPWTREVWRHYHRLITAGDAWVGKHLEELKAAGLADNTIVFFTSDHGAGLPRGKTTLYELGMRVPLIVHIPKRWQHLTTNQPGSVTDQLVSFVDFGPTVLQMAGVDLPSHLQGRTFLGAKADQPRRYVYGVRDRFGAYCQTVRVVRGKRYKYFRNYRPGEPLFPYNPYHDKMPVLQEWRRLDREDKLAAVPRRVLRTPRPREELYDVTVDSHELKNLAASPEHKTVLDRMRAAHLDWSRRTRDLGLMPEADMFRRAGGEPPFDAARRDRWPLERIRQAADTAGSQEASTVELRSLLADEDPAVRYWGVWGVNRKCDINPPRAENDARLVQLNDALGDIWPSVRIEAARGLSRYRAHRAAAIETIIETSMAPNKPLQLRGMLALQALGPDAASAHTHAARLATSKDLFTRWVAGQVVKNIAASP